MKKLIMGLMVILTLISFPACTADMRFLKQQGDIDGYKQRLNDLEIRQKSMEERIRQLEILHQYPFFGGEKPKREA